MAKIIWVEDQSHWIDKFQDALKGVDLDGRPNQLLVFRFSEAARQKIAHMGADDRPDIALLDARMNGNDRAGFSVSSALLNKWPGLPIIFLSEHSGTGIEEDALTEYRAADFIAKHQRNVEDVLCWRMCAVLRHQAANRGAAHLADDDILCSGELRLDLDTWEVYWKGLRLMNPDNPRRPLAPTPRKILRCLVERSPRPVTTPQIAEYLGVDPDRYSPATYRQHIKTLRRAIDVADGGAGEFIEHCKSGYGIASCGEQGAYGWKKLPASGQTAQARRR
ncbi:MAG TPA: response regulator transcription factor [Gammaproteobacteria bacterium]|nr:response regulator transcription factor [Gammaproteobacteria bacterium]